MVTEDIREAVMASLLIVVMLAAFIVAGSLEAHWYDMDVSAQEARCEAARADLAERFGGAK